MSSELLIQCPDGQMKTVPLTGEKLAVGRSSAAELCFPEDAGLSRQHFSFETDGDNWTVQDLGSKNGTFVNNIPLKARLILKPGDRITAGHLVVVFAPDAESPNAGVVVFEGGDRDDSTSWLQYTPLKKVPGGPNPSPAEIKERPNSFAPVGVGAESWVLFSVSEGDEADHGLYLHGPLRAASP